MTFRRTDVGISNLYLFHGVDMIVFVEGGLTSYTVMQLGEGYYNEQADDLKYWHIIFTTFAPNRKVHLRAAGSNVPLLELADLIATGKIKRTLVAMDRDFRHITSKLTNVPGVITTIGYSWENDVWTPAVVFATFKRFNTNLEAEDQARGLIDQEFAALGNKLRGCVLADAILSVNNLDPLPRGELKKVIQQQNPKTLPIIVKTVAKAIVRARRQSIRPHKIFAPGIQCTPHRDCYGHLWGDFAYLLLAHALRKFAGIRTTPKQLLIPAAIDVFSALLHTDLNLVGHYTSLFSKINWNA